MATILEEFDELHRRTAAFRDAVVVSLRINHLVVWLARQLDRSGR